MKDSRKNALEKKKGTYSFLTKKSFRVDAKGNSPSEAYKVARTISKHHEKNVRKFPKDNNYRKATEGDKLSGTYFKYDKEGLHANEGRYSQIRPKSFHKGYNK